MHYNIILLLFIFSAPGLAEEKALNFSVSFSGWHTTRENPAFYAVQAILNNSAGTYHHLRGGHTDDEPAGPEFELGFGYRIFSRLTLLSRIFWFQTDFPGSFVDQSREYKFNWKTTAVVPAVGLAFKLPYVETDRLGIQCFAGVDYYLATAEIKSTPFIEEILDTRATGRDFGYHSGLLFEIQIVKNITLFFKHTEWHAEITPVKKAGKSLKLNEFRADSAEDLALRLDGLSALIGFRVGF